MAPVLSAVWGPGVAGSAELTNGQLAVVGTLSLSAFLLLALLLLLCASCQGQKKANGHPGDHENLMNGVSEKETCSQSADSHATDLVASSSHNGPLTSGTVLTDTMDTSPHPSEEMLSSQSELRSSKCPQDRELPSIPPSSTAERPGAGGGGGDSTYEVVKEGGASRDISTEDSLYETVKELKGLGLTNGTLSPEEEEEVGGPPLLNGHLSPSPGPAPLAAGAEYASVDLNKKSRYSADLEARRSAAVATAPAEEPEEEKPPPIPDKVLDENDNQPTGQHATAATLHNGELHSPLSPTSEPENHVQSDSELSALYSTVVKPRCVEEEERESDYSSISEIKAMVPESTSCDLYATVREVYPSAAPASRHDEAAAESGDDPGYETIRILKTGEEAQPVAPPLEPDYESVGDLGLNRETSRL